jgi:hypothetical protein
MKGTRHSEEQIIVLKQGEAGLTTANADSMDHEADLLPLEAPVFTRDSTTGIHWNRGSCWVTAWSSRCCNSTSVHSMSSQR